MSNKLQNEFEQSVRETPIDKVNWDQLSEEWCADLSIEFIREYSDYLNWTKLARYKKFSKDLIREFKDKLDNETLEMLALLGDVKNFIAYTRVYSLILEEMEEKMPEPWYNYGFGSAPEKKE